MVKITHNQNVLAWLLDSLDVVGSEFSDIEIYTPIEKREEQAQRLRDWETATKQVIQFGWLC